VPAALALVSRPAPAPVNRLAEFQNMDATAIKTPPKYQRRLRRSREQAMRPLQLGLALAAILLLGIGLGMLIEAKRNSMREAATPAAGRQRAPAKAPTGEAVRPAAKQPAARPGRTTTARTKPAPAKAKTLPIKAGNAGAPRTGPEEFETPDEKP
jgi:hypothetical protein